MRKKHGLSSSILSRRVLAGLMAAVIFIGCFTPKFSVVEMKAMFVSADMFQRQPLMKHYFDVVEFSQRIMDSFYMAQCMTGGAAQKQRKRIPVKKMINDLMFSACSLVKPRTGQQDAQTRFSGVDGSSSGSKAHESYAVSATPFSDSIARRMRAHIATGMPFAVLFLLICLFMRPRGNLDGSSSFILTNYIAAHLTQPGTPTSAGFFSCRGW